MPDREKVIKGLEQFKSDFKPFCGNGSDWAKVDAALALLKEQEAVKPEREHSGGGTTWWNVCGNCKTAINPNDKYCHECGQAVKWE